MQTDLPAISVRQTGEPVGAESDAGIATVWLAFYLLMLAALVARPVISDLLQLAGLD